MLRAFDSQAIDILESMNDAFVALDPQAEVVYINRKAKKLFSIETSDQALGRSVWDILPVDGQEMIQECWGEVTQNNKSVQVEFYYPALEAWLDMTIIPSQDGVAIYCTNISRQKQLEHDTLVQSEENFRLLANSLPQIVWSRDNDGKIDYFNDRWYEFAGQPYETDFESGWLAAIHPEDLKPTLAKLEWAWKTGEPYQVEYRLQNAEGKYKWFLEQAMSIKNKRKKVIRWFGTNTNIDEQKQVERRKNEFISIASHELKTPLTSIKGYIQILERIIAEMGDEKVKLYLSRTNTYVDRLDSLIADLLDVSKIQAGRLQFDVAEFEFDQLVQDAVEGIQPTVTTHSIVIHGKTDLTFQGDRYRLEQVVTNLLSNAIKYAPSADRVDIFLQKQKEEVRVEVVDYGIGISKLQQDKIFKRFYRAEESARRFSGLGIGLYISAEIIRRHGGEIGVKSEPGKGSTFYFTLPLKVQDVE